MTTTHEPSPFSERDPSEWIASNELAFALWDRFPVSQGHALVIPKRVVASWFDATREEQHALLLLVDEVKGVVDREFHPDGYNVGFNAGEAAGQTVMHLHVHVIPRYRGDMDDPRGGVRGVIPSKQKYVALPPPTASSSKPFARLPSFVHGDDLHFEESLRSALIEAERADILSAFVQTSGVARLRDDLRDALVRGAQIRLLTGDYMGITRPDALRELLRLAGEHEGFSPFFFEVDDGRAFHPKAYIFVQGAHGVAYVGSSNVSKSALTDGVEWNLRLISSDDAATFQAIQGRFEALLKNPCTKPLTRELIDAYELRAPERPAPMPETRPAPPEPNPIQREALDELKRARREGKTKGLVVLATGLGKTYLSAFDFKQAGGERALFVAHREEILEQAKDTWQAVFPDKEVGTYGGGKHERDVDLLFASVSTIARAAHLARFAPQHFDYIVIDEFHHAAASTYRKLLGHFTPRFLLGLTATPERMDGQSLLELCGDNLIHRSNLVQGISQRLLVPFRYFAVKDIVDFEPIPWRSGKFDAAALTANVATEAHAEQALAEYERRAADGTRRTLCFCCTVEHADFMADFFRRKGKKAVAVHSGATSAPRARSLRDLKAGKIEIICAVDVFNEGVDAPEINTVIMLRPTESPIIFLQQLGRGLRRAEGKDALIVVDFIGNHRSFLSKPQSLLFLLGQELPPHVGIEKLRAGTLDLPDGCSVHIDTEALDLLASMVRVSQEDVVVYEYMSFRDAHGRRSSAAELFAEGVGFKAVRDAYASWFDFVRKQADLTPDEERVLVTHAAWFGDLLRTKMTKGYKMMSLRALIDADALFRGMDVSANARRCFDAAHEDLLLFRELREDEERRSWSQAFVRKWRHEPLSVWARGESTTRPWFKLDGDTFEPAFDVAVGDREVFEAMTEEMVELRLAEHRDRLLRKLTLDASQAPILMSVASARNRVVLKFDRARRPDIPRGEVGVEANAEEVWIEFGESAATSARKDGSALNSLSSVLRQMFGPTAGQPGITHRARIVRDDERWRLEPDTTAAEVAQTASIIPFVRVPYYADVKVACGAFDAASQQDERTEQIAVQPHARAELDPKKHFVVRADGDSMNGGDHPIEDGDLVLCEWTPGVTAESVQGRAHLLVGHDMADSSFAVIKVPVKTETGWRLESWNPEFPVQVIPADAKLQAVAKVLEVVKEPTELVLYGTYDRDVIAAAFGSKNDPSWRVGHRDIDVAETHHTVLMVTLRKGGQTKIEHRYADRFLSAGEFQWESQASTKADSLKGRRIRGAEGEPRTIHLFVQYESHQDFTYLGPVTYVSHEGQTPMRVRFRLAQPLTEALWRMWR